TVARRGAGRHAAGPLCGEGDPRPPTRPRRSALPLPRQGQPRHHRARRRRRRHQGPQAERADRLDDLAVRPPLVPGRLPEPDPGTHPLGVQLLDAWPRRTPDHRRGRARAERPSATLAPGHYRGLTPAGWSDPPRAAPSPDPHHLAGARKRSYSRSMTVRGSDAAIPANDDAWDPRADASFRQALPVILS